MCVLYTDDQTESNCTTGYTSVMWYSNWRCSLIYVVFVKRCQSELELFVAHACQTSHLIVERPLIGKDTRCKQMLLLK